MISNERLVIRNSFSFFSDDSNCHHYYPLQNMDSQLISLLSNYQSYKHVSKKESSTGIHLYESEIAYLLAMKEIEQLSHQEKVNLTKEVDNKLNRLLSQVVFATPKLLVRRNISIIIPVYLYMHSFVIDCYWMYRCNYTLQESLLCLLVDLKLWDNTKRFCMELKAIQQQTTHPSMTKTGTLILTSLFSHCCSCNKPYNFYY